MDYDINWAKIDPASIPDMKVLLRVRNQLIYTAERKNT